MEKGTLRQNRSVAGKGTGGSGPLARRAGRRLPPRPARGRSNPGCRPWGLGLEERKNSGLPGEGRGRAWPIVGIGSAKVGPSGFPPDRKAGATATARAAIRRPPSAVRLPRRKPFNWARKRASDRPAGLTLPTLPPGPVIFGVRVGKQRRGPARTAQGGEVHSSERGLRQCVRSVANRRGVGQPGHRRWHTGGRDPRKILYRKAH